MAGSEPAAEWTVSGRPGSKTREQLLAAAEHLFAERGFSSVSVRMINAEAGVNWSLVGCLPVLPADDALWRFHFMLGTIDYSASSPQRITAFSRGRCDPGDLDGTVQHLVPFLAAAFRSAPVSQSRTARPDRGVKKSKGHPRAPSADQGGV